TNAGSTGNESNRLPRCWPTTEDGEIVSHRGPSWGLWRQLLAPDPTPKRLSATNGRPWQASRGLPTFVPQEQAVTVRVGFQVGRAEGKPWRHVGREAGGTFDDGQGVPATLYLRRERQEELVDQSVAEHRVVDGRSTLGQQ